MKNKNTILIILAGALLAALVIFQTFRMNSMEERYMELLSRQAVPTVDKNGRTEDPYIAGPVKNTVTKHTKEILDCYQAFLDRNRGNTSPDFRKEGAVHLDWQIDKKGAVISPQVINAAFGDETFHSELTAAVARWTFPEPPYGKKKYIEHTFTFKDEQGTE